MITVIVLTNVPATIRNMIVVEGSTLKRRKFVCKVRALLLGGSGGLSK